MVIEYTKGNAKKSIDFAFKALKLFEELEDFVGIADIYNNLGIVFADNSSLALEYYLKALEIKEEINYIIRIGQTYQNIGVLYREQNELDTAMEYFEKALTIFQQQNSLFGIGMVYGNIGLVYEDKEEYSQAAKYQRKSLEIATKLDYKYSMASAVVNLGNAYKNMGEYDQALACYRQGLQIFGELQNGDLMAACLINIGRAEMMRQNYETTIDYLNQGLELAKKADAKIRIQNAYENLSKVYEIIGEHEKALEYLHLFIEVKDEIFNIEKRKQIALIHAQYETKKNQLKISHLERELSIKEASLKNSALSLARYNEFVQQLTSELDKIFNRNLTKSKILHHIKSVMEEYDHKDTLCFTYFFNEIHGDFIQNLSNTYPQLTPREIQVCTLLRTNLSSKEIAEILYISQRSVDEYRRRIRDKLSLDNDRNLISFLLSI